MKIGELAERTGLAPSRIRFYEDIGLLKVERESNGYRTYPSQTVLLLNLITGAQQAGFSLDEIRTLLPPDLAQWQHGSLVDTLRSKVQDIEALEMRLAQSKAHLVALLAEIEAKPAEIDCATNAKRVLSRLRSGELESPVLATSDVTTLRKATRRRPARSGK
ncbi:MerR family transcriptional regulator [Paraburkholderia ginsengiterrae]|uniref:MerR family transcriptional regulator n=1 Tax=Paraburkholderia ginsengiterrae TaxID=1462993 RepID=A0A1A9NDS7_9BURK|nr:MerR family transcriptional regulator [Paraburkholderia ginsengiterrae]OAJ51547.1 MerR family transcriptional regulator [Paraburkholderia ginsengiterrae]OAJ64560.1 MerR family transcriptional regulator [Paraburkholderia ginsengiterrae]